MHLRKAVEHAKWHLNNPDHPAVKEYNQKFPAHYMIKVANGQYLTTSDPDKDYVKNYWTFEDFVAKFGHITNLAPLRRG